MNGLHGASRADEAKRERGTRSITWKARIASDTVKNEVNADFYRCIRHCIAG